jgi:hypothetical protein
MSHIPGFHIVKWLSIRNLHSGTIIVFNNNNERRCFVVTLNILLILLGFINSVSKKSKDVTQINAGEIVLCGDDETKWPC